MEVTILEIFRQTHPSGIAAEATITGTIKGPHPLVQTIVIIQDKAVGIIQDKAGGVEITKIGIQGMVVEDQAGTLMVVECQVGTLMVVVVQAGITIHRTLRTTIIKVQHLK